MSVTGYNRSDFGLNVGLAVHAMCALCGHDEESRPILLSDGYQDSVTKVRLGICEPCSYLASWRWRESSDNVATPPFPQEPSVVLVMVVRERKVTSLSTMPTRDSDGGVEREVTMLDPVAPYDVVMVTRKEEPWAFALPGGKVEPGEEPLMAAVRELHEETNLSTWPSALEVLHDGFTARGKLARVYICRAYAGDPRTMETGVNAEWKVGPLMAHAGAYKGFYFGLDNAFKMKTQIQSLSGARVPLCTRFGKAGQSYVNVMASFDPESLSKEDQNLLRGYKYAMTEEEKMASEFVCRSVAKAPPPSAEAPVSDDGDGLEGDVVDGDDGDLEEERP